MPDAGWSPGFDLNIERTFETKRQQIHSLQEGLPFGEVGVLFYCLVSKAVQHGTSSDTSSSQTAEGVTQGCEGWHDGEDPLLSLQLISINHAVQGRHYSQREYQEYADLFKEVWLDGHPEVQAAIAKAGKDGTVAARVLEEEYWCAVSIAWVSGQCK